jgi:membrane-bound lytic murein transglycosylase B
MNRPALRFAACCAIRLAAMLASVGATAPLAFAAGAPADAEQRAFAAEVAAAGGPSAASVLATLAGARVQPSILQAIARPAEKKPWKDYRPIFVTEERIEGGRAFYREHRELLESTAREYGVPAEVIVAILGVETRYGAITGKYRVLDALATLAFHYPPRAPFFRSELKQLFLLEDMHLAYAIEELTGSYAGAMGWGQFMPSSIANYARDGDADQRIDLWDSLPDITASIANYFAANGWETGAPVVARVQPAADARHIEPGGLEPVYPVEQMEVWGYAPLAPVDATRVSNLVVLEGEAGDEYWLTFRNFYVISRYNRSALYSMAVWQLAQGIADGVTDPHG